MEKQVPKMYFIEAIQELINIRLNQKFRNEVMRGDTIHKILVEIREAVFEVFHKMNMPFADMTKRYVAQELFKCLSLNGDQEFLDLVQMNEIKLKEIPTSDLRILVDLMHNSDFEDTLKSELNRR